MVNGRGDGTQTLTNHGRRMWRWVAFDPPLRIPGLGGCCTRKVLCLACGESVGATNDPVDAVLIAWRHRKTGRRSQ